MEHCLLHFDIDCFVDQSFSSRVLLVLFPTHTVAQHYHGYWLAIRIPKYNQGSHKCKSKIPRTVPKHSKKSLNLWWCSTYIGVGAGRNFGVLMIFARILPNLPKKLHKKVTYKKVFLCYFGCHFAHIFRRLLRISRIL